MLSLHLRSAEVTCSFYKTSMVASPDWCMSELCEAALPKWCLHSHWHAAVSQDAKFLCASSSAHMQFWVRLQRGLHVHRRNALRWKELGKGTSTFGCEHDTFQQGCNLQQFGA